MKLIEYINSHADGFTVNPCTLKEPKTGYVVAYSKKTETRVAPGDEKAVRAFLKRHRAALKLPNVYLGGWADKGDLVLDCVIVVKHFELAHAIGRTARQEYLYNLDTREGEKIIPHSPPKISPRRAE